MRSAAAFCPTCGHAVEGHPAAPLAVEPEPASAPVLPARPPRRRWWVAAAGAVVALGVGVSLVVGFPAQTAVLALQVVPDVPFDVGVAPTNNGARTLHDGDRKSVV